VKFQQIDKTAGVSKFGHTTYANIYMGCELLLGRPGSCLDENGPFLSVFGPFKGS
jgi:hypothetical protein